MGTHIFPGRGPYHQVPLPEAPYNLDGFLAAVFERHTFIHSLTVPCRCTGLFIYLVLGSRVHPHSLLGVRNHLRSVVDREDLMAMADP